MPQEKDVDDEVDVIVEEGTEEQEESVELTDEEETAQESQKAKKEVKKESKKESKDGEDGESEEEEDSLKLTEEEAEQVRAHRRREREQKRQRREKAIERNKVELNYLRQRNEELERRMMAQEMRAHRQDHYTVEQQIAEAENEARTAEAVLAKAIAEANGDDAAQAIRIRDEAMKRINALTGERNKLKEEEKQVKQPKQKIDPVVTQYANDWVNRNSWYTPNGKDADSRIVLTIDQGLVEEGYVPSTELYWQELDRRVRRYLPHRYESESASDDDDDESEIRSDRDARETRSKGPGAKTESSDARESARAKKGPPLGQQREHAPATTRREVYISKERKEALVQAGVWDDPVLRTRYIKQYQKWDKENQTR